MSDSAEQRTVKLLEKTPPAITLLKMSLIYLFLAGKRGPREGLYVVASWVTLPENKERTVSCYGRRVSRSALFYVLINKPEKGYVARPKTLVIYVFS
jgi:hypothetical protein